MSAHLVRASYFCMIEFFTISKNRQNYGDFSNALYNNAHRSDNYELCSFKVNDGCCICYQLKLQHKDSVL
ncbi:hypothetical protein NSIN_20050 [Nitrosotalea sinensis]|uniref:Uncharacterized protein n=1 Tax=Nitrosotalea sinensis TaxID=1499975 RepID=A0A2H1EF83_9ARCH|nr:hypothetical protein NSIN_20050 [Candidatus Nitrosotalea sinensis]